MNINEFQVLNDNVLLEVLFSPEEEKSAGGIIIPATANTKEATRSLKAIVHGIGSKVKYPDFKVGDKVWFENFGIHPVDVKFDDSMDGVFCLVSDVNICLIED